MVRRALGRLHWLLLGGLVGFVLGCLGRTVLVVWP